jgi:hypothetical protein
MPALFIDTTFGFLMRNISGGRLFKYEDQYNEELREEYFNSGEIKDEESSDDEEKNGSKGKYKLIEFRENDPDVRRVWIPTPYVHELTCPRTRKTGLPSRSASLPSTSVS